MNKLRIIFIGTPDFAVTSLKSLVEGGKNVVAVITAPDRKAGRGRKIHESAVKQYALENQLPLLQPTNLKNEAFLDELKSYEADLQIVVAFRMLPESVWNMPPKGTFNLHASLLPNYRGAAPINWAIINGEKRTGLTTFFLKHQIDTGDIILQEEVAIEAEETAGELHDKLMKLGGKLVLNTVNAIEKDKVELSPQSSLAKESLKAAPKIYKEDCEIKWNRQAKDLFNFIRGLSPYPTAWTQLQSKEDGKKLGLKLYKVSFTDLNLEAGEIQQIGRRLFIGTASQALELIELQVEGKRRMSCGELINGFDISKYSII